MCLPFGPLRPVYTMSTTDAEVAADIALKEQKVRATSPLPGSGHHEL